MANKHASLNALFTDIADAIREKTGDSDTIVAAQIPSVIRERLEVKQLLPPIGTALNDMTWEEIRAISDAGLASSYFAVGDRKEVTLNGTCSKLSFSNQKYYCYIIGIDHNSDKEGTNRIHFQFCYTAAGGGVHLAFISGFNDDSDFYMNSSSTNAGGWNNSFMRNTVCAQFKTCLPSDLQSVLKTVTKYSSNNVDGSNTVSNMTSTTDDIFLLSEWEVFGAIKYANYDEKNYQAQYAYYSAGNSKVRYQHSSTGSAVSWWLRSVRSGNSKHFCRVEPSGIASTSMAQYSIGFAPCFCV